MSTSDKRFITASEFARRSGIPQDAVLNMVHAGTIPHFRTPGGGRIYIHVAALDGAAAASGISPEQIREWVQDAVRQEVRALFATAATMAAAPGGPGQ